MSKLKLNVLLAKVEHSASIFKQMLLDYASFFKGQQGQFKGYKKTYAPREGTIDEPSMRGNQKVVTTVAEKMAWIEDTAKEHINNLFSVEATNASNTAKAELVVDNINFGFMSSLELLRLKSLLDSNELDAVYQVIPVRSDAENWSKSNEEQYKGREIFELEMIKGVKKGTVKEPYILKDPNVDTTNPVIAAKYAPQVVARETIVEHGDYTAQQFSGESTHLDKARILRRKSKLKEAVIEALKKANEAVAVPSEMTAEKLFGYLHRGKI